MVEHPRPHEWTTATLHAHLIAIIDAITERVDERYKEGIRVQTEAERRSEIIHANLEKDIKEALDTATTRFQIRLNALETSMRDGWLNTEKSVRDGWLAAEKAMQTGDLGQEKSTTVAIASLDKILRSSMDAMDKALHASISEQKDAVNAAMKSTEKAVALADANTERRFTNVNEFRAQLTDQAATFIPRTEANAKIDSTIAKLSDLSTRLDRIEAKGIGMNSTFASLAGGLTLVALLVAAAMAILGYVHAK